MCLFFARLETVALVEFGLMKVIRGSLPSQYDSVIRS